MKFWIGTEKNTQWNIPQSGGRADPQQSPDPVQYTLNVAHLCLKWFGSTPLTG